MGDALLRIAFIAGLLMAPLFYLIVFPKMAMPEIETRPSLLILAGILVGFGTRLGSGCTSGHGICGISRASPRSLAATLTFMLAGLITVFIFHHIFGN